MSSETFLNDGSAWAVTGEQRNEKTVFLVRTPA